MASALPLCAVVVLACGDAERAPPLGPGGDASGGEGGQGASGGQNTGQTRQTLSGDITWTVTFDAAAQQAGASDCSYTRHYEGVEDESRPWLCPACDVVFRADVTMVAGGECYPSVSQYPPSDVEWIGWAGDVFMRGAGTPLSAQGTVAVDGDLVSNTNAAMGLDAPAGGLMAFDVAGQHSLGSEPGDARHGYTHAPSSYECGWPTSNAPEYAGDYTLVVGQTVPDGLFHDRCGELVRLHDFAGAYLIIDMSAMDCPPCQAWASQEESFVSSMRNMGVDVHVITLLAPSLADPLGDTSEDMLGSWAVNYDLFSPVLADRAWGISMFLPTLGEQMGYPSWVVVDPDLKVIEYGTGFSTFAAFEQIIASN